MSQARSALYQGIQIGEQTSFGTLVSATKRIANVPEFEPKEIIKVKGVNTSGVRGLTGKQRGPEHTEARFSAALDFYLFSMFMDTMFGKATPVVASGVGTRTYAPSAVAQIAPRFLTIESGSAVGAEKFGDALVTGMSVKWSKEMADMEGTIVGTELLTGITPTTGLDMMMNQAVNPIAVSAFLSTDNGSTYAKVADVIEGELRFEGMREPKFYSDSDEPSFNKWVEKIPDFGASLTLELGSEHDTMLARVKTNEVVWLGFKCLGSLISGSTYHEIKAYMPMYVMQPDRGKKDTVMGNTFMFNLAHEDTSKTIANVVTKLASGSLL